MKNLLKKRDRILKILAGKLEGFYLAGGTALSVFYFQHRDSYDVDFFTKDFSRIKIEKIISELLESIGLQIKLDKEQNQKDKARMLIYYLKIDKDNFLKIDFVEDMYDLIGPLKTVDGISVLSKEDIYIRKIFTICGSRVVEDLTGRRTFIGGRQEAKDFFDLYFLSTTFMPLSKFAFKYCTQPQKESIVIWYRTYDRMSVRLGLNDIITDKKIDYHTMEHHFKQEIEQMIKQELG